MAQKVCDDVVPDYLEHIVGVMQEKQGNHR